MKVDDAALARFLEEQGRLVRVGDGYAVSAAAYEQARAALVAECESAGRIALARFRDLLGVGRRRRAPVLDDARQPRRPNWPRRIGGRAGGGRSRAGALGAELMTVASAVRWRSASPW